MTRRLLSAVLCLFIVAAPGTASASAGLLKKLLDKALDVSVASSKAPVKEGLKASAKAVVAPPPAAAELTADGAHAVTDVHHAGTKLVVPGAEKIAGRPGQIAAELGTDSTRLRTELTKTAIEEVISAVVSGDVPLEDLAGIPGAGVVNSANARYERIAQPLPKHVKARLQGHFPDEVLDSTRYAIGQPDISLPARVSGGRKVCNELYLFGCEPDGHAVTIDDIVVFSREPGANYCWWAHELHHVMQYRTWGVTTSGRRYPVEFASIEAEANANAKAIEVMLSLHGQQ